MYDFFFLLKSNIDDDHLILSFTMFFLTYLGVMKIKELKDCFSQVIAVAKSSDIVLMVLDASKVSIFLALVIRSPRRPTYMVQS